VWHWEEVEDCGERFLAGFGGRKVSSPSKVRIREITFRHDFFSQALRMVSECFRATLAQPWR
jgi:hypothetical protein